MRTSRRLALVLSIALALAACSSSSGTKATKATTTTSGSASSSTTTGSDTTTTSIEPGTGPTAAYARGIAKGLTNSDPSSGLLLLTPTEASCVAPLWADAIGLTLLHKGGPPSAYEDHSYDFAGLGLDETQASTMVDAFATCHVDLYHQFLRTIGQGLSKTAQTCIASNLPQATVQRVLIKGLQDPSGADMRSTIKAIGKTCHLGGTGG